MRYMLLITILLSFVMPVSAQGDDDPLYTIESEGWFVTTAENGNYFYSNNEDFNPDNSFAAWSSLSEGDLAVNIELALAEDVEPSVLPTDSVLFMGMRFGAIFSFMRIANPDATVFFSAVDTAMFNDLEFHTASITIEDVGTLTSHAHVTDEYAVFFDIYHTEDTDIEPAIELLETVELLFIE